MRFGAIAAAALLTAHCAQAEDRALIIGIDDYSALPAAPILTGAVGDADRMVALLSNEMGYGQDQIVVLRNAQARHDAILSTIIDRLIAETRSGDRVFLYFAGLGTVLEDGAPAIMAHDAETVVGHIPVETLSSILGHIADREVTVVLDTGFTGGPVGSRGFGSAVAQVAPDLGDGITLWAAAQLDQFVWEDPDGGVFTQAWTHALETGAADANGDFRVTQSEMLAQITPSLENWCTAHASCATLTPALSGPTGTTLRNLTPPEPEPEPILTPIEADDGLPASYRETLGFVTDLFSPSNDAGLTLGINGGENLQIGEAVSFTATSARAGALLLLDLDPSGGLAQVYPSVLSPSGATEIGAGQTLTIPSAVGASGRPLRIRVTGPAGPGLLLGLFIEGDLGALAQLMPAGLEGGPIPNGNQSLFEISQDLLRMEADPDNPIAWSAAYLPYRIEP